MMVLSCTIASPSRRQGRVLDRFLTYARSRQDVWFARKDEIARWVLSHRAGTPVIVRNPHVTACPVPLLRMIRCIALAERVTWPSQSS